MTRDNIVLEISSKIIKNDAHPDEIEGVDYGESKKAYDEMVNKGDIVYDKQYIDGERYIIAPKLSDDAKEHYKLKKYRYKPPDANEPKRSKKEAK